MTNGPWATTGSWIGGACEGQQLGIASRLNREGIPRLTQNVNSRPTHYLRAVDLHSA